MHKNKRKKIIFLFCFLLFTRHSFFSLQKKIIILNGALMCLRIQSKMFEFRMKIMSRFCFFFFCIMFVTFVCFLFWFWFRFHWFGQKEMFIICMGDESASSTKIFTNSLNANYCSKEGRKQKKNKKKKKRNRKRDKVSIAIKLHMSCRIINT